MEFIKKSFIFLCLFSFLKGLSSPIQLAEIDDFRFLGMHEYEVFEDSTNTLTIQDIHQHPKVTWSQLHYFKNLNSTYWLKYTLVNNHPTQNKWVLELLDPHIDEIEFYQQGKQALIQGFEVPFETRVYQHKNQLFDINTQLGDTTVFYLKIKSKSHISFSAKLQTNTLFSNYSLNEYFFLGIFYGFLFIMILYNLILYLFTGMRTRIYYTLYVISAALNSFTEDGIGFQYLWPSLPQFNHILADSEPLIYLGSYIIYTISFLDIGHVKSKFKIFLFSYTALFTVVYLLLKTFSSVPDYWLLFYIVPFLLILYYSINEYIKKKHNTRFLIVGTLLIFISFFILFLRMQGSVENSLYVVYFFNFAVTIEIIMFSMAIGDKLRFKQAEHLQDKELIIVGLKRNEELKDKVNRELEQKVAERTQDLNEAKEQLELQAQEITTMNLQLDLQNHDLNKKVIEVSKKRVHGKDLTPEECQELFPDKVKCFQYLEEIKWNEGFECRKCSNTTFSNGSSFKSRRCTKCGTSETPTANTVFHGLRMPIEKAFYLFALIIHSKGNISSSELEKKSSIGQKACWSFKQKIITQLEENESQSSWNSLIIQD